ncbi:hypothetical protein GOP47_0019584 [Adiantum capillus-veneris]|uniref:Homeobox domain-containing protein n=1 Tax=Adiantum capillus-veneris TaxID=13818 RepID=A0A9D4UCU4_ADICA|nr:hypothetical protein GOP47_0019584 [Adiantum capillus-veneris]
MSSATPFGFPNATELLMHSATIPHYLYTAQVGGQSESPGDGSISAGESTVTSIKTENWTNTPTARRILENRGFHQAQQETSHSTVDRLALLASVASESMFGSDSSSPAHFTPNMSAYISGPNAQSEALQTLHLMNSNFTGYGDSSNTGNMVLYNTGTGAVGGGQGSPLGSSEQHQQHFARFTLPSAVNQTSYSHPSHMATLSNTELSHQNTSADLYSKRTSNQGYNWGGGSEFSFLPSGHVGESNQEIGTHINLMKPGQLSTSDISHFGVGSLNASTYHEQAPLFANNVATAHGVNMDNLQAPSSAGHILSLSLSPQQPSVMQQLHSFSIQQNEPTTNFFHGLSNAGSDGLSKEGMFPSNKCTGNNVGGSFTIPSCENMLGAGYHPQLNAADNRHVDLFASHLTVGSYGSKYLKPAQELLNEVVSVGQGLKSSTLKRSKSQSWTTGLSSGNDSSFMKSVNVVMESPKTALISWNGGKEAEAIGTATTSTSMPGNSENLAETVVELSSADRQELQAKRAKLVGMRDEVDRRYKQYYHQMQVVATSFESAAGLGAAAAYTALALQTISKHFRCLRDAITGQIQATCKALGEEEVSGITRGQTSKLRFIDQELRQQRALRQLGMMQQQAWRPQRGLPEHSVSILRAWLFEHFLHPYPKDADKIMLAKQTGLNRNQVSNWFINARVRLWKPMVEEMYIEETKEAEAEIADQGGGGNEDSGGEGEMAGMSGDATSSEFSKPFKQPKLSDEKGQGFGDMKGVASYSSDLLQGRILSTGSPSDHLLLQEKEGMRQGAMKLRPASQDVPSLLAAEYKTTKASMDCAIDVDNKVTRPEDSYKEPYGVTTHSGFVQADQLNLAGYGSYQLNGMNRYGHENFGNASYAANGGVSLTLGLQHCEGLTFSGGQQHYATQGGTPHLLTNRREEDGSADYYNVNENGYEVLGLQSRKPFPAHMLCHDFVV